MTGEESERPEKAAARSLFLLATELSDAGRWEDAVQALTLAIENDPLASRSLEIQMGSAAAVPFDPSDGTYSSAKSLLNRAIANGRLGRWAEAVADYQQLSEICPEFQGHFVDRGRCHAELSEQQLELGLLNSAVSQSRQALDLVDQVSPENAVNPLAIYHVRILARSKLIVAMATTGIADHVVDEIATLARDIAFSWPDFGTQLDETEAIQWRSDSRLIVRKLLLVCDWLLARTPSQAEKLTLAGALVTIARSLQFDLKLWDLAGRYFERARSLFDYLASLPRPAGWTDFDEASIRSRRWQAEYFLGTGRPHDAIMILEPIYSRGTDELSSSPCEPVSRQQMLSKLSVTRIAVDAFIAVNDLENAQQAILACEHLIASAEKIEDGYVSAVAEANSTALSNARTKLQVLLAHTGELPRSPDWTRVGPGDHHQDMWRIDLLEILEHAASDEPILSLVTSGELSSEGLQTALGQLEEQTLSSAVASALLAVIPPASVVAKSKNTKGFVGWSNEVLGREALAELDRTLIITPHNTAANLVRAIILCRLAMTAILQLGAELGCAQQVFGKDFATEYVSPIANRLKYYVEALLESVVITGAAIDGDPDPVLEEALMQCSVSAFDRFLPLYPALFAVYGIVPSSID